MKHSLVWKGFIRVYRISINNAAVLFTFNTFKINDTYYYFIFNICIFIQHCNFSFLKIFISLNFFRDMHLAWTEIYFLYKS